MEQKGTLTVYYGPMYSGKSKLLIEKIKKISKINFRNFFLVLKPYKDDRKESKIVSRDGIESKSISIKNSKDILNYYNEDLKYVFIDEFQFFDKDIISVIKELKNKNINIFISTLDTNFKKEKFLNFKNLYKIADEKINLSAYCSFCGNIAYFSSRKLNGEFETKESNSDEIVVDNKINKKNNFEYFASCEKCHPIKDI